jgi:hypothetical protein
MVTAGRLADIFGRRIIIVIGLAIFGVVRPRATPLGPVSHRSAVHDHVRDVTDPRDALRG